MELDAGRCYRAVRTRDRRFDGRFFTGVLSTGIYCRPVCPARTPRRDGVRFFACAAAAEAAGFRACLRCRPEAAPGTPAWVGSPAVVGRALRLIADGGLDGVGLAAFAERLGVGERQLARLFRQHVGVPPGAVARARRAHLARRLLRETQLPMTEVAAASGFESLRSFNHDLRRRFGLTPGALRRSAPVPAREVPGELVLELGYRPPLAADALLSFLGERAVPGVEAVDGSGYRRTIRSDGGVAVMALAPVPGRPRLALRVRADGVGALQEAVGAARRVFDLDADPEAIARDLGRSPALAQRVARRPGLRIPGAADAFECTVRAVLGQQVTVRGARTLATRLVERFGTPTGGAHDPALTRAFPTAATLAEADLAGVGLPASRARALRALAAAVARGRLVLASPLGLDDWVARATGIPGIGPWTAHYVAMRALGEPDAFPASDLGLRRAFAAGAAPAPPRALEAAAESWRPWRAYAALHLWSEGANP